MTLTEQVVSLRRTLNRILTRRLAERTDRAFPQLRLLRAVAKGKVETQSDAADHLLADPATVCRMVDRLEEDGVMKRCEGRDRRSGRLEVTARAKDDIAALDAELLALDRQMRGFLEPDEYDTLSRLLGKLQAAFADPAEKPKRG